MIIEAYEIDNAVDPKYWEAHHKHEDGSNRSYFVGEYKTLDELLDDARGTGYVVHVYTHEWYECVHQRLQEGINDLRWEMEDVSRRAGL